MYHYCLLVLLLCYNVICDDCVTYTFEENENVNFTNTYGICHGMRMWNIGKFSSLDIESPHRLSTTFLQPQSALSCVSSFKFLVTSSATLEVNVYMEPTTTMDQVTVLVFQSIDGGADPTVANAVLSPLDANFTPGWHTMKLQIIGTGTYEGYITFLGMASESSIVLIDSFRYIAPSYDSDLCIIYKDESPEDETTIEPTVTTTPPATTEESAITDATVDYTLTVATPSSTEATVDYTISVDTTSSSTEATADSTIPAVTTPSTTIDDFTVSLNTEEPTTINAITTTSSTVKVTTSIPSTTSEEASNNTTTDKTMDNTAATPGYTSEIVTSTTAENITQSTTVISTTSETIADTTSSTSTTTEKVTPTTRPTTIVTKPSTTIVDTTPSSTTTTAKATTTPVTQPPSTSQRPNLSISLLLLKINKFLR